MGVAPPSRLPQRQRTAAYAVRPSPLTQSAQPAQSQEEGDQRRFLSHLVRSAASVPILVPASASAAAPSQRQKDEESIVKGYSQMQYLLDHWEAETTVCKTGQETTFGDKCKRTPLKVMDYLGSKSTTDPLFKADVTMMRLKDAVPPD
ncbi:hypothetical protein ACHAWF_011236 [Thalassiosira exigua]